MTVDHQHYLHNLTDEVVDTIPDISIIDDVAVSQISKRILRERGEMTRINEAMPMIWAKVDQIRTEWGLDIDLWFFNDDDDDLERKVLTV